MSRRPVLHRTPYEKPCHCEPVTDVTGVAIRNTQPIGLPVSALPTAAPFLSAAKEREERTPSKPMVLKSFPRLRCRPRRSPLAPRIGLRKPRVLPSCRLCVSIRDARPACAGLVEQGKPLRLPCGGVRGPRPTKLPVGRDPCVPPPGFTRHSL